MYCALCGDVHPDTEQILMCLFYKKSPGFPRGLNRYGENYLLPRAWYFTISSMLSLVAGVGPVIIVA